MFETFWHRLTGGGRRPDSEPVTTMQAQARGALPPYEDPDLIHRPMANAEGESAHTSDKPLEETSSMPHTGTEGPSAS